MRDGWRMTSGVATGRMADMDPEMTVRTADMDPELEAFIPLFPPADLTHPAAARKNLGIHAGTFMSLAIRPGRSTKRQEQGI